MALFPPGKGGGQSVDYGYKGKGVTTHLLVDGNGMPLSATATPASGSEREQVSPLLQRVRVYHGSGWTSLFKIEKRKDAKTQRRL